MTSMDAILILLKDLSAAEKAHLIELVAASLREELLVEQQVEFPALAPLNYTDEVFEDDEGNINPLTRRYRYLPSRNRLFEAGILKVGDRIFVRGHEGEVAEFINPNEVTYNNKIMKLDAWAALISGQKGINVYKWCVLEREGETLDALRLKHLGK